MSHRKFFGYSLSKKRAFQVNYFIENLMCGISENLSNETRLDIAHLFRLVRMSARKVGESYLVFGTFVPVKYYNALDNLLRDVSLHASITMDCDKDLYNFFEEILVTLSDELGHYIERFY